MRYRLIGLIGFCLLANTLALPSLFSGQDVKQKADLPRLLKELADENPKLSEAAARSLEKLGIEAIEQLLLAFEKGDEKLKSKVALILGNVRFNELKKGNDVTANAIEDILVEGLSDPRPMVINWITAGLATVNPRSAKALPRLLSVIKDRDKPDLTRVFAAIALRGYPRDKTSGAIPLLLECLMDKKIATTPRSHFIRVLIAIDPENEKVLAAIKRTLNDPNEALEVRCAAASGIGELDKAGVTFVPDLMEIVTEPKRREEIHALRFSAAESISKFTVTKNEVPGLLAIVADGKEKDRIRYLAAKAIDRACEAGVANDSWKALLKILTSETPDSPRLERAIIAAIGKIGPPAAAAAKTLREYRSTSRAPLIQAEIDNTLKRLQRKVD